MANNPFLVEAENPIDSMMKGMQQGIGIRQYQEQLNAQAAAQQRASAMNQGLYELSQNPNATAKDYARFGVMFPESMDNLKKSWELQSPENQSSLLNEMSQVYAASLTGNNDLAKSILKNKYDAAVNSGDAEKANTYKAMIMGADSNPNFLRTSSGLALSSIMGADKFGSTFESLGKEQRAEQEQPYTVMKAAGDAQKSMAEGDLAYSKGAADIENTREETKSKILQRDIDRAKLKLDAAKNETERMKLQAEIEEKQSKLLETKEGKYQAAQSSLDSFQDSIDTIDRVLGDKGFAQAVGSGGDVTSYLNSSAGKQARTNLETVQAQQFLSNLLAAKAGGATFGSLTEQEGAKIQNAVANITKDQSAESLKNNLGIIRGILTRRRQDIIADGNLRTEGGRFIGKNASGNPVTEGMVNKYMISAPDVPREKIVKFLMSK